MGLVLSSSPERKKNRNVLQIETYGPAPSYFKIQEGVRLQICPDCAFFVTQTAPEDNGILRKTFPLPTM